MLLISFGSNFFKYFDFQKEKFFTNFQRFKNFALYSNLKTCEKIILNQILTGFLKFLTELSAFILSSASWRNLGNTDLLYIIIIYNNFLYIIWKWKNSGNTILNNNYKRRRRIIFNITIIKKKLFPTKHVFFRLVHFRRMSRTHSSDCLLKSKKLDSLLIEKN